MFRRAVYLGFVLALASTAQSQRLATTALPTPQIYVGVGQPVAGKNFQVYVLVEQQADASPAPTGTVTVNWGDGSTATVGTLTNSTVPFEHDYASIGSYTITTEYSGDTNTAAGSASQKVTALSAAPPSITFQAYGDSITAGHGSTYSFPQQIQSLEGWTPVNLGVGGANSIDICGTIYAHNIVGGVGNASPSYSTLLAGENDLANSSINTVQGGYAEYASAMLACAAWLAIPTSVPSGAQPRKNAQSDQNALTGTWTASDLYTSIGLKTTVAGSTLTSSFTGNVFYAGLTATTSTNYEISIAIDGVVQQQLSPQLVYPGVATSFGPVGVRIPLAGASSVTHKVTFTCITPGTSGCYVDWFGGNGFGARGAGPFEWLATPFFNNTVGVTDTPFLTMTNSVIAIQQELYGDGLSAYLANTYNTLVGQTQPQCFYDDRHPNACGDTILATTFGQSMNALLAYAPPYTTTTALSAAPSAPAAGQTVTLTAAVSRGAGLGTVTGGAVIFSSGGEELAELPVSAGQAVLQASSNGYGAGAYPVVATYIGDTKDATSTSSALTVNLAKASPSVAITASPSSVKQGAYVTLSATVARPSGYSGFPAGTVTFQVNGVQIATAAVNTAGSASFTAPTGSVSAGIYPVVAIYNGDNADSAATSAQVEVTVSQ